MPKRRTKYQTAKKQGMRKFPVKPGKYYYYSSIKSFNSKSKAQKFVKNDKKDRGKSSRHRVVKTSKTDIKKGSKNYTVYRTFYP